MFDSNLNVDLIVAGGSQKVFAAMTAHRFFGAGISDSRTQNLRGRRQRHCGRIGHDETAVLGTKIARLQLGRLVVVTAASGSAGREKVEKLLGTRDDEIDQYME